MSKAVTKSEKAHMGALLSLPALIDMAVDYQFSHQLTKGQ